MKSVAALLTIPATTFTLATVAYAGGGGNLIDAGADTIESFIEAMRTLLFALLAVLA